MPEQYDVKDTAQEKGGESLPAGGPLVPVSSPPPRLPARILPGPRRKLVLAALALIIAASGAGYWWLTSRPSLPPGIAWGNGRIEADEIDIDTKFAGRIARLLADEGDMVHAGQVVAVMDTQDLEASLRRAEAVVRQARRTLDEANANVAQQRSQMRLAQLELDRARYLLLKNDISKEVFDQRQQQMDSAKASLTAAEARVGVAEHALDAATHDVELYRVNIGDNTLVAPRDGRIQYRIANVGEVLPAGGKVFTTLDTSYVYMDIYLPTADAGRVRLGADARIRLDAYPDFPIPAKVTFLATQAQFTPKAVETKNERDKLMFRVKLRIDPELLRKHAEAVRTGLPGVGYVLVSPTAAWPPQLKGESEP